MQTKETRGLVLYNRPFREDDKLVKIFTETSGKHMFFVRHVSYVMIPTRSLGFEIITHKS